MWTKPLSTHSVWVRWPFEYRVGSSSCVIQDSNLGGCSFVVNPLGGLAGCGWCGPWLSCWPRGVQMDGIVCLTFNVTREGFLHRVPCFWLLNCNHLPRDMIFRACLGIVPKKQRLCTGARTDTNTGNRLKQAISYTMKQLVQWSGLC